MSDSYYVPEDNIEDEYLRKDEEEYDSVYYDYYDDIEYDLNDYVYSDKNEKKEKEEKHNDSSDNHQYFDMKKISGSKNERPSKINYSKSLLILSIARADTKKYTAKESARCITLIPM